MNRLERGEASMEKKATSEPALVADKGKHYKTRAAEEYAAAVKAGLTEQEATVRVARHYFVSEATFTSWLRDAEHAAKK
jgi:hypothetical protein